MMHGAYTMNVGMVDYQYFPEPNDPVSSLRMAMSEMDGMILLRAFKIISLTFCNSKLS